MAAGTYSCCSCCGTRVPHEPGTAFVCPRCDGIGKFDDQRPSAEEVQAAVDDAYKRGLIRQANRNVELDREALHKRLDVWIDRVEEIAPNRQHGDLMSLTFEACDEIHVTDDDRSTGIVTVVETRTQVGL